MVIVAVRFAAKFTGSDRILVDNTFVHFLMVTALSMGRRSRACGQQAWRRRRPPQGIRPEDRAWLEVDLGRFVHNARTPQRRLPEGWNDGGGQGGGIRPRRGGDGGV